MTGLRHFSTSGPINCSSRDRDPLGAFEFIGQVIDERLIEIVAAQVRVAVDAENLKDALAHVQHRHVERAAAQVEDADLLVLLAVQPVSQCRGRRLGEHADDLQSGDFAGVLGRLALGIVEIRGNGDDRVGHLLAQVILGGLLQILKDDRTDGLGRVALAAHFHLHQFIRPAHHGIGNHLLFGGHLAVTTTHEPLDTEDSVLGIGHLLVLGVLAHQPFALFRKRDDRRRQPAALGIDQHLGLIALHDGHDAVGCPQVDTDNLAHERSSIPRTFASIV
jgi:hypothetical protein